ncbi:glycoside hydrolase [Rhypophila decipiens]|uniref:alpha-amylase n=1 Tax=Rhypophila decipiens TaxID=261697 RepID=A0AAN7BBI0_9PEZI|nr:glycoside hydrolase [Rhypophila decipiens]
MRSSVLNIAAALALAGLSSAANMTEWKSQAIYQVLIDRFARTDGSTTAPCELSKFCGGTWAGLIKHLDYIQDMGFTAIQISPVVENMEGETSVGEPYHGYWTQNMYAINKRFGTEQDLKDLSAELHKRGMLLMVDVVVNHMAQKFDNVLPPKVDYTKFKPFNKPEYYHKYCNVTEWKVPQNYQECWLYPFGIALADLKTEDPAVSKEMNEWVKDLVANYSIDGLRIDAAKHVNDGFLAPFVEAAGVFSLGEVLTGEIPDMCRYQTKNLLPGMPNYLEYFKLNTAFNGGGFEELADIRNGAASGCTDVFALGAFSENHDLPRFPSMNNDMMLAKNMMTYVLLTDGIPTIYQGQEQHFNGSETPHNREPVWQAGYDKTAPLYVLTANALKVRKNAQKLSANYTESPAETLKVDGNHLCLKKGPSGSAVVFCVTNKSSSGDAYEYDLRGFEPNDEVVEVLDCKTVTADATGTIKVYNGGGEPKVYVLLSNLEGTGLCPKTEPDAPKEVKNSGNVLGMTSKMAIAVAAGWLAVFLA